MPLSISTSNGGSALVPNNAPPSGSSLAQPNGQYFSNAPTNVSFTMPTVTLPSVPNPTPPPPQKVAVVNSNLAQKDLSQKQGVSDGAAQALDAQTKNNLAGIQPSQQQQNGQQQTGQQTQQQGTQQQQQNGGKTTDTKAGTQNPNASQVTLPGGIQASYDSATGTMTTADGKQLAWNQAQGAWIDPTTGVAPITGGGSDVTGVPSTGDPATDYLLSQYKNNQAQADANSSQYQSSLSQILNGTFPLTADQQQQVASLQSSYDQLKRTQQLANDQYVKASQLLGIRAGRAQYQPGVFGKEIHDAVSDGVQKIADLDNKAAGAVSTLKQGFMDNDYKIINDSYTALQNALTQKDATLDKMQATVKNQVDLATAKLNQQKTALDLQTTEINNLSQSALKSALKLDGTLDLDQIQKIADENGVDANALYGAVNKAHQDEIKFQQEESKFATDQLQAGAQLAATKQSTKTAAASEALTYANIAKTRAETAALQPLDTSALTGDAKSLVPAFNSAVTGLPAAQAAQAKATFASLVKSGDVEGAKNYIVRVAASSLPTAQQSQVIGRTEAIDALTNVQTLLDQAKAKGNGTGLVKGTLINTATKLGQSDDADLQYIGSRIQQELQVYRRAMTGVAFSPAESAQYSAIFPDITNVDGLNTTKIQALTDGLNTNNRTDLSFAVGAANYDKLFGKNVSTLPSDKNTGKVTANSVVSYGGKNYTVDAAGNMTEVSGGGGKMIMGVPTQ